MEAVTSWSKPYKLHQYSCSYLPACLLRHEVRIVTVVSVNIMGFCWQGSALFPAPQKQHHQSLFRNASCAAWTAATILSDGFIPCRYLPIGGLKDFNQVSVKLAYGDNAHAIKEKRVAAVQSLSGTGSCRLMGEFMKRWMPGSKVCVTPLLTPPCSFTPGLLSSSSPL